MFVCVCVVRACVCVCVVFVHPCECVRVCVCLHNMFYVLTLEVNIKNIIEQTKHGRKSDV